MDISVGTSVGGGYWVNEGQMIEKCEGGIVEILGLVVKNNSIG